MVMTETVMMKGVTFIRNPVMRTSPIAKKSSGIVPTQNFDQSRSRMESGLERSSHIVRPSRLTPGNMKRAAIDASTNPASTWLRKGIMFATKNVTPSPLMGRNLMLNT